MKVGRNDPCPCGSGKKYKNCCYAKDSVKHDEPIIEAVSNVAAEDEDETNQNERQHHQKDRSRFQGEARGGSSSFRPRATRGAQRGA